MSAQSQPSNGQPVAAPNRAQRRTTARKRNRRTRAQAWALKGATRFSDDPVLGDPVQVLKLFRTLAPQARAELIERTTVTRAPGEPGRNRMQGSWGLAFLAHMMSGNPDWQNWWTGYQSSSELWRECGFEQCPAYQTVYLRFRELEDERFVSAFTEAANKFIRIAAAAEPRAFRFFHTDGTAAHSHAKLEHACPNPTYCESRQGDKPAETIERASDELVSEARQEQSALPEDEDPVAATVTNERKLIYLTDEEAKALDLPDWRNSLYLKFGAGGHIMRCRDKGAGVRAYRVGSGSKTKAWVGGYFLPAQCNFFWAPVALHFFSASQQEHLGWPELYRKTAIAIGDDPDRPARITGVVADRAFTNKTFIKHNTDRGVASITPERKLPGGKAFDTIRDILWDEHGPRCKHCGGPTAPAYGPGEGFTLTGVGEPRLRFRCALGWTKECGKVQAISCRKQYLALLPISRRERVFHDVMHAHQSFEGIHDSWRDRYAVAGTSNATRSKRRYGLDSQKLRGAAALLAEWFRICLRQGYIAGYETLNPRVPVLCEDGAKGMWKVKTDRAEASLELPRGPAAVAVGLPEFPGFSDP